jgi:hypothetical protein
MVSCTGILIGRINVIVAVPTKSRFSQSSYSILVIPDKIYNVYNFIWSIFGKYLIRSSGSILMIFSSFIYRKITNFLGTSCDGKTITFFLTSCHPNISHFMILVHRGTCVLSLSLPPLSLTHAHTQREVINFMDCFTTLCFMASSAVHAWTSFSDLLVVGSSYQLQ